MTEHAGIGHGACFLLITSGSFLAISGSMLSELIFTLLAMIAIESVLGLGEEHSRPGAIFWLCASLACLQRFLGITLILLGFLVAIMRPGEGKPRSWADLRFRALGAALPAFLALLPLLAWLVRNCMVAGTAVGTRSPSTDSLFFYLGCTLESLAAPVLPSSTPDLMLVIFGALVIVPACFKSLFGWRSDPPGTATEVQVIGLFVVIYTTTLYLLAITISFDDISPRFMFPVAPFLVALTVHALEKSATGKAGSSPYLRRWLAWGLLGLLVLL